MTRRRGMTLVEVLVVSALLLLLLGIVAVVLRPGLAAWRRSEVRSDLQGNVLLSLRELARVLEQTPAHDAEIIPHVHPGPDGGEEHDDALVVMGPDGEGATRVHVFFVRAETHELWHAALDPAIGSPDHSVDQALSSAVRATLQDGQGVAPYLGRQRRVGRFVEALTLRHEAGPFTIEVEARESGQKCALRSAVTPVMETLGEIAAPTPP